MFLFFDSIIQNYFTGIKIVYIIFWVYFQWDSEVTVVYTNAYPAFHCKYLQVLHVRTRGHNGGILDLTFLQGHGFRVTGKSGPRVLHVPVTVFFQTCVLMMQ